MEKPCLPGQDFTMTTRRRADGSERLRPISQCKPCRSKTVQEGKEARRRGEFKKTFVDVAPLSRFLEERVHRHGVSAVALATGMDASQVERYIHRYYKRADLSVVDRVLVGLNCTDLLESLYPQE